MVKDSWSCYSNYYSILQAFITHFRMNIVDQGRLEYLANEFRKDYMISIQKSLSDEKKSWKTIFPSDENVFNAFNSTPFESVKVVILGQDPYHGDGQAHGLSFSVPDGIKTPPSLRNMYKELLQSGEIDEIPESWNLTDWANQWVLLLNAILTVEASNAASHRNLWRQNFTDKVIEVISKQKKWVIFLLWWGFAKSKISLIDQENHHVLTSVHPSPLSAYRGFLWSNCFKETNELLKNQWDAPISW